MRETAVTNGAAGRRFWRVLALAAVAALPACGGGGSPSNPSTPAPTPPPRTVLPTQTFVGIGVNEARFVDIDVLVASATVEGTADWTFAFNDLDIYVTNTSCAGVTAEELSAGACALLARADSVTAKPERISFVASQGRLRVWVANFGPGADSGTLQIIITGR